MTLRLNNLITIGKHNIRKAGDSLGRAFSNYPDLVYFFPEERQRNRITCLLAGLELYMASRYGEVYGTSGLEGVAIWMPPGSYPLSNWRVLRSTPLSLLVRFALSSGGRFRKYGEYLDSVHRRLAPFPHWYLETLGVAPEYKGQGYASRLLRPMLERTDKEGLPCYLETGDEKNVSLYEHFGFRLLEKSTVPGTPLNNWAMLREAGK